VASKTAYHKYLRGLCKAHKIDLAVEFLNEIKRDGVDCKYSPLLQYYCDTDLLDKALQLVQKMVNDGQKLDTWDFNCLIKVLCANHKRGDALKLLEEMRNTGVRPDSYTYLLLGLREETKRNKENQNFMMLEEDKL